jgi:hypothetical protein
MYSKERYGLLGVNGEMLESMREMLEALVLQIEGFLSQIADAKFAYRNLFIFLNEGVIKIAKQTAAAAAGDVDNCKNHLAKMVSNKEVLLRLCASKDSFYMANISAYFDPRGDEQAKHQAAHSHVLSDPVTGLIYERPLLTPEAKGTCTPFHSFILCRDQRP